MALNGTAKVSLHWLGGITIGALTCAGVLYQIAGSEAADIRRAATEHAELRKDVDRTLSWIADYEKNIGPLRQQFIAFTGELPGIRAEIADFKTEGRELREQIRRLNDRLDGYERREGKRGAAGALMLNRDAPVADP